MIGVLSSMGGVSNCYGIRVSRLGYVELINDVITVTRSEKLDAEA